MINRKAQQRQLNEALRVAKPKRIPDKKKERARKWARRADLA